MRHPVVAPPHNLPLRGGRGPRPEAGLSGEGIVKAGGWGETELRRAALCHAVVVWVRRGCHHFEEALVCLAASRAEETAREGYAGTSLHPNSSVYITVLTAGTAVSGGLRDSALLHSGVHSPQRSPLYRPAPGHLRSLQARRPPEAETRRSEPPAAHHMTTRLPTNMDSSNSLRSRSSCPY